MSGTTKARRLAEQQRRRLERTDQRIESRLARDEPLRTPRCDSCKEVITGGVLRVNFSPPMSPWKQLRFHDLLCLLDFLEDEEEAAGAGRVFTSERAIDSLTVPVSKAPHP